MIRKNSLNSIELKRTRAISIFISMLIVVMAIGFWYFNKYSTDLVMKKQVDRVSSYTNHNAKLLDEIKSDSITKEELNKLYYTKDEDVFIVKRTGQIIYTVNNENDNDFENIFDIVNNTNKKVNTVNDIKGSLLVGSDSGTANVKYNGKNCILCFSRVDNSKNWYVVSVVELNEIVEDANAMTKRVRALIGFIILGTAGLGLFYYFTDKKFNKSLRDLVYKDALTGNISYARFLMKSEDVLKDNKDKKFVIYYGDIKSFKYINDTFGYDVGDRLLIYISESIKKSLGNEGIYARVNADNFVVLREYENREDFIEKIYNVLDKISDFGEFKKENYKPEVYVGAYCNENFEHDVTLSEMIDRANMAQKSIKGSNEFHLAFYNEEIRERIIAEKEIERKMENALSTGEFVVFYQPKYDVRSGEIVGAEALVRWNSPERGLLLPGKFIPLFEQNGFIVDLDQYVFESVCKSVREWLDNGKKVVSISINVSRVQFYRLDFVKRYTKIKNRYAIPDGLLELEFTESIVLENIELLQKIVNNLKANGFVCSIDDFGSGYSSLNILKNLPMDVLKLDRLFFKSSENTERDKALIASVVTMARALKMKTVSEGIETWNQVNFLKEIGCDIIQGYVYSEPISKGRFEHLVEGKKRKLPEAVPEKKKINVSDVEKKSNDGMAKYLALLNYEDGAVIETDYENDTYNFIKTGSLSYILTANEGKNITNKMSGIIETFIHPDDRSSMRERVLPMGVLASFYQGEDKIITDFRMLSENMQDYTWCRITILRVKTEDLTEFKSIALVENIEELNTDMDTASICINKSIESAVLSSYNMIYEVDFNSDTFRLVYYSKEIFGDRPENGEYSWLREQFCQKNVHPDDFVALQNFISAQNIRQEFQSDKDRLMIQARMYINDKVGFLPVSITVIKQSSDCDTKVIFLLQIIDELYENTERAEKLTEYVNNAICDYYDLVYLVDLKSDEATVVQAHHSFSNITYNTKYSVIISELINEMIRKEDVERISEFFNPDRIVTAIKLGNNGDLCEFECKNIVSGHTSSQIVMASYIKIPSENDSKLLFLVKDIYKDKDEPKKNSNIQDSLNKIYKKETTEIMINESLDSVEPGETRAFILLDISNIESLTEGENWSLETKATILDEFSQRLSETLSGTEIMCRSGGYEFIILSDKVNNGVELSERLNGICNLLKEPLALDFKEYKITGNMGVSIYGVDGTNFEKLYLNADISLAEARTNSPDSFSIYNGDN